MISILFKLEQGLNYFWALYQLPFDLSVAILHNISTSFDFFVGY